MSKWLTHFVLGYLSLAAPSLCAQASNVWNSTDIQLKRQLADSTAEFFIHGQTVILETGSRTGPWTLVALLPPTGSNESGSAVLEDYSVPDGHLIFVDQSGIRVDLSKSSEPTSADPSTLYLGRSLEEIKSSADDLLARQILSAPGDPRYEDVAGAFPPIRKLNTYSFVGTHENIDKVGFLYGGRTPNFDPAPYYPLINEIREQGKVLDGLVGGYLPVLRFVYPEENGDWTEMIAFAPLRISNDNNRIQPVWYRVSRIEGGNLKWAKYIDSYHPFPPRTDYEPKLFYADLAQLRAGWKKML